MTLDIAAMKADMEAGAPGPWRVGPVDDTVVVAADGSEIAAIDGDYNEPDLWPMMEANARRIARVPDMEETLISQAAEIERLKYQIHEASDPDFLFGAMDNVNDLGVSLADFADAASRAIRAALGDRHE